MFADLHSPARRAYPAGAMSAQMNKTANALAAGLPIPPSADEIVKPESVGAQIQKRAAYGRVTVESITRYLEVLAETGQKVTACAAAHLSLSSIQNLRKMDPEFAEEEERARETFIATYIDEPFRRFGLIGVNRIIIDKDGNRHEGERVIQPQIALAYARKFDKAYRDKQEVDVNHSGGVVVVTAPLQEVDLESYARKVESERRDFVEGEATPSTPAAGGGSIPSDGT